MKKEHYAEIIFELFIHTSRKSIVKTTIINAVQYTLYKIYYIRLFYVGIIKKQWKYNL